MINAFITEAEHIEHNHIYNKEAAWGNPQELFFAAFEFVEDILKNNSNICITNYSLLALKSSLEFTIINKMREFDYPLTYPYAEIDLQVDDGILNVKFGLWINGKYFRTE